MTVEEAFINELKQYIDIQPCNDIRNTDDKFLFNNVRFTAKVENHGNEPLDPNYILISPEGAGQFDCEKACIFFVRNDGKWFFGDYSVRPNDFVGESTTCELSEKNIERLKVSMVKAIENSRNPR